jgi:hypothetical protein
VKASVGERCFNGKSWFQIWLFLIIMKQIHNMCKVYTLQNLKEALSTVLKSVMYECTHSRCNRINFINFMNSEPS